MPPAPIAKAVPSFEVRGFLHPRQDLFHLSSLWCGLERLHSNGSIHLSATTSSEAQPWATDALVCWLEVLRLADGARRKIAVDLYDRSDVGCLPALQNCDLYLKRSFHRPCLPAFAPPGRAERVVPFGLNYACRSRNSTLLMLRRALPSRLLAAMRSPRQARTAAGWHDLKGLLVSPLVQEFEIPPESPLEPAVIFQTRVWEREDLGPDRADEVNGPRVALVRLLRKTFGSRFLGGLVPSPTALRLYPDAITTLPTRRRQFIAWSRRPLVGIYTRGLHHSLAFKLPEYLAASKCIVSEPLRNELPAPLEAGRHYLAFQSPEECVEACRQLLDDPRLTARMREENWKYYREQVEPSRHLWECLHRVFSIGLR